MAQTENPTPYIPTKRTIKEGRIAGTDARQGPIIEVLINRYVKNRLEALDSIPTHSLPIPDNERFNKSIQRETPLPIDPHAHQTSTIFHALHTHDMLEQLDYDTGKERTEIFENGLDLLDAERRLGPLNQRLLTMARSGEKSFFVLKGLGGSGKTLFAEQFTQALENLRNPTEKRIKAIKIDIDYYVQQFYKFLPSEYNHHPKWSPDVWKRFDRYMANVLIDNPDGYQISFEDRQNYDDFVFIAELTMGPNDEKDKADSTVQIVNNFLEQHPDLNKQVEWIMVCPDEDISERSAFTRDEILKMKDLRQTLTKIRTKLIDIRTTIRNRKKDPHMTITDNDVMEVLQEKVKGMAPPEVIFSNIPKALDKVASLRRKKATLKNVDSVLETALEEKRLSKKKKERKKALMQFIFHKKEELGLSDDNTIILYQKYIDKNEWISWYTPNWFAGRIESASKNEDILYERYSPPPQQMGFDLDAA